MFVIYCKSILETFLLNVQLNKLKVKKPSLASLPPLKVFFFFNYLMLYKGWDAPN